MSLAALLQAHNDDVICDLAETYHIYDYHKFGGRYVATLIRGLRPSSRLVASLTGEKVPQEKLMLARLIDEVSFIAWTRSADGAQGVNRPKSILAALLQAAPTDAVEAYNSGEEFMLAWDEINKGGEDSADSTG